MQCLSKDHPAREVVLRFPSQSGKSEVGINLAGYVVDHDPGPMLIVQPTVEMGKRFSKQRLSSLVKSTETVREKIGTGRQNNIFEKEYPGGVMFIGGANSAASLASMPIKVLNLDEIDRYPDDVDDEGCPVKITEKRTSNFPTSKTLKTSTPTVKGASKIDEAYERTNQCKLHLPCPHCGTYQELIWNNLNFPDGPESAHYICEHCDERIDEHEKRWMLQNLEWVPENPDAPAHKWGFAMNALSLPLGWVSWAQLVEEFLEAQGNPFVLRTFVNTRLARSWEIKGVQPQWENVYDRREDYEKGVVPEGALVLTAGVDVQKDRLEVEVVGWGPGLESWSVDHIIIRGDTAGEEVWDSLKSVIEKKWPHESGGKLEITRTFVDSGYRAQKVYTFCREYSFRKVTACKGSQRQQIPISSPTQVERTKAGNRVKVGVQLIHVGTDVLKREIYGWILAKTPKEDEEGEVEYPGGWCHFPDYPQEYFRQLCAEKEVKRVRNGRATYTFVPQRDRNEALDMRVYARAAAIAENIDWWTEDRWNKARDMIKHSGRKRSRRRRRSDDDRRRSGRRRRKSEWMD